MRPGGPADGRPRGDGPPPAARGSGARRRRRNRGGLRGHVPVLPGRGDGRAGPRTGPHAQGAGPGRRQPGRRCRSPWKTAWRNRCRRRTPRSTSSSPAWCCAAWRTSPSPWRKWSGSCGRAACCCSMNTSARPTGVLAAAEDLLTPLWSRVAGGCHPEPRHRRRDRRGRLHGAGPGALRLLGPPRQPAAGPRSGRGEQALSAPRRATFPPGYFGPRRAAARNSGASRCRGTAPGR